MTLTVEEENFCQQIASGQTKSNAFRTAFLGKRGWKATTIASKASVLTKKPAVALRIEALKKESSETAQDEAGKILRELADIAFMRLPEDAFTPRDKLKAIELLGKVCGVFEKDNQQKSELAVNLLQQIVLSAKTHGVADG